MVARFTVDVEPDLLDWVVDRAGMTPEILNKSFPDFVRWKTGRKKPTFKQLEKFAKATHAPLGYFFLAEPPEEYLPIPDFRTMGNAAIARPTPDLLDVLHMCQLRQDWYKAFIVARDSDPLPFVGSASRNSPIDQVADEIRGALRFDLGQRGEFRNWEAAYRQLIDSAEDIGVLVMISGIVESNTHRVLNPEEFRGFALSDHLAPVIFVNGADSKAAQIFTLVHELAHIWLGESALSDARMVGSVDNQSEKWCNSVAAQVLIPLSVLRGAFRGVASTEELQRLARIYRVSTLMVLKRIYDAGFLSREEYSARYSAELDRVLEIVELQRAKPGGNYYRTQPLRLSRQFARAVIVDTLEGGTLHRDAYGLLGTAKHETFARLGRELGVT
jgi:Zn-dependent peptidase ImmA (M78 family)